MKNDQDNTVWQDDLASIHTMIALFLKNQGDLTGADKEQKAALAVMKLLTSNDPKNVNWQAGVASSYEGISSILQLKGDIHGALDTGATAMIVWQNLAKQDSDNPHWRYRLAMSHAQIAGTKRLLNDSIGAISEYNAAEQLLNTLKVEVYPNYLEWQYQISLMKHLSGVVLLEHSDLDGARTKFLEANKILEDLAARDPSNTKTHSLLAESLSSLTMVAEDRISALQYARKSQEIAQHLTLQDPDNTDFKYLLSESHDAIGSILRADGNFIDSLSNYRHAQKILDALTHTNAVQSLWKMRLISVYCNIGGILQAQNDFDGASVAYSNAKDIIDGITDHVDIDSVQFPLKRVHLGLGGIKWAQGDWAGALNEYEQSNAVTEQQARRYPSRDDLQLELALNQKILSYLLTNNGDQVGALDASRSALRILQDLVQRDPDNVQTWELLRDTISAVADISHALTRYREAVM